MKFIFGSAGASTDSTFKITINGKKFFYHGDADEGFFVEEVIYNSITAKYKRFTKETFQAVFIGGDKIYFSTFNDNFQGSEGDSTVEYIREEFSIPEIMGFISELILDNKKVFLIEQSFENRDTLYNFKLESENINFTIKEDEIVATHMISELRRIFIILKNNYPAMLAGIFTIILPILIISFGNKALEQKGKEIIQAKIEENKLKSDKAKKEYSLKEISNKFNNVQHEKDILESGELENVINSVIQPVADNAVSVTPPAVQKVEPTPLPPMPKP